jgi:hypothetical protein
MVESSGAVRRSIRRLALRRISGPSSLDELVFLAISPRYVAMGVAWAGVS